ncbi:MAG: polyprenyl synthetase family protein [Rhodothermales bacterium]
MSSSSSTTLAAPDASEHIGRLTDTVNRGLAALALPAEPARLYEPVRYVLDGGGKRLRPALLLLAAEVFDVPTERALPAALAVEVFHNFTLVHDDIMDHAEERRGRPSVHILWDESTAILAGDLMMGMAYDLLAQTETDRLADLIRVFHRMVARLCEGQALDEQFETEGEVTVPRYLDMIDRKTGALLEAVLELGGLIGGADAEERAKLAEAGHAFGRAFQIQDDLLDLTADDEQWGKTIGGDLMEGKKTFLLLRALERAGGDERAWFRRIVTDGGLPEADIAEARRRMDALGVLDEARTEVLRHYDIGERAVRALPAGSGRDGLLWIAGRMARRVR